MGKNNIIVNTPFCSFLVPTPVVQFVPIISLQFPSNFVLKKIHSKEDNIYVYDMYVCTSL